MSFLSMPKRWMSSSSVNWIILVDSRWICEHRSTAISPTFCLFSTSINFICFLMRASRSAFCFSSCWFFSTSSAMVLSWGLLS
ncbi:unnamed protein product [Ixodes persulcatus]